MTQGHAQPTSSAPARRTAVAVGALAACLLVVSLIGSPIMPAAALGTLLLKLGTMWPALVYLAAAHGLGAVCSPLWRRTGEDAPALQLACGLALMFTCTELLGIAGLLSPAPAIALVGIGFGLGAAQLGLRLRSAPKPEPLDFSLGWILAAPAAAVLLVAASMPPGWLWASEYGAFDALSYHLPLAQEWLALERVRPLEHNVYSFLPGYIEAAFAHLGALTLAPRPGGLLGGDGWRLISCQALHAGLTLIAAWLTARAARRLALSAGADPSLARWGGAIAGGVTLATPWAVVTGSLAYNEAGVNAMLAGALLVCLQPHLAPAARGGLVGALVGVACGFKATSLLFAGIPAGVALVAFTRWERPRRQPADGSGAQLPPRAKRLAVTLLTGAAVGFVALWPWLFRNEAFAGNPIFPFATDLFGLAHWTQEQVARWNAAHTFDGSLADRLRTLVWTSPTAAPGTPAVERFRGYANPQWGLFLPFTVLAASYLLVRWREARAATVVLGVGLLGQVAAWLTATHLQSRFLLPTLPIGAILIGLAAVSVRTRAGARPDARAAAALLGGVVVLSQTAFLLAIYVSQKGGSVGYGLAFFPEALVRPESGQPEQTATGWTAAEEGRAPRVYLVGDSTPLYFGPVLYHTTYDASPLGEAMRAAPDDPAAWAEAMRGRGVDWLIVNPSELARLQQSGWYDPLVTPDAVRRFAETQGGAALVWPDERRYLVELGRAPTSEPPS